MKEVISVNPDPRPPEDEPRQWKIDRGKLIVLGIIPEDQLITNDLLDRLIRVAQNHGKKAA
jgi:hypothetical protein